MDLKESISIKGEFQLGTLTGTNWSKFYQFTKAERDRLWKEVHSLGFDDILAFWRGFGARQMDGCIASNRVVNLGLECAVVCIVNGANGVAVPTLNKLQQICLGRDATAWSFPAAQTSLGSLIADGGGFDAANATIASFSSGSAGAALDTVMASHTFVATNASLYNTSPNGVKEAGILSQLNVTRTLYCRMVTPSTMTVSTNGDSLIASYKSRLIG